MIDLLAVVPTHKTAEVTLLGHQTGFFLHIRHESAPEVEKVRASYTRKFAEEARKGNKNRQKISEEFNIDFLAAQIAGWEFKNPEFTLGGEQPPFSVEKAKQYLSSKTTLAHEMKKLIEKEGAEEDGFLESLA